MAAPASPPLRPAVRLRPVPPLDPPFADDPAPVRWPGPVSRQLPLDLTGERRRPRRARHDPVRPGPARPVPGTPSPNQPAGPAVPLVTASAEATRAAHRFATTYLEFLNGYRPVSQVRSLTGPADANTIAEQIAEAVARLGSLPRQAAGPRVRLRVLRACEPRPGVVEAAAVLDSPSNRTWALAFRLERRPGRWVATVVQSL